MKALRHLGSAAFVLGLFATIFVGVPWHVVVADDPVVPWWLRAVIFCLLGGILVVLATVAIEQRQQRPVALPQTGPEPAGNVLLSSCDKLPGRDVAEVLGLAQGQTVFAIWLGRDLSAIVRLVLGGELTEYTDMMGHARAIACERMVAQATAMGADAVINVRYMTTSVIGSAAELLVYGTAVKLRTP